MGYRSEEERRGAWENSKPDPRKRVRGCLKLPARNYPTQPRGARDPSFASPYYLYHYYIYLSFSSDSGYQQEENGIYLPINSQTTLSCRTPYDADESLDRPRFPCTFHTWRLESISARTHVRRAPQPPDRTYHNPARANRSPRRLSPDQVSHPIIPYLFC